MKRALIITGLVVFAATILFYITDGIATDAIDDMIARDIATGDIPQMSLMNVVLLLYTIVIVGTISISIAGVLHDEQRGLVAILACAGGLFVFFIICSIGDMSIPGLQMTPEKWLLIPAFYLAWVSENAAIYLISEACCILGSFYIILLIMGVEA